MGEWLVYGLYIVCVLFLFGYGLFLFHLAWIYRGVRRQQGEKPQTPDASEPYFPKVTIQLPIYNEESVVVRLLEKVLEIKYPQDKLDIQILDDSTNECSQLIRRFLKNHPERKNIAQLQREDRKGFKAGALKEGLQDAKGEFIAIFDADFLPESNFLTDLIPHFQREEIGMVQSKWGHINKQHSILTKIQAFGLDAHFTAEQRGRSEKDYFLSFNGTAGIWRKTCIEAAGGWSSDTLTEDLDLSIRAQLAGWKFLYIEDTESPAELPITVSAYKSQQYRWNKGAAETHKKLYQELKSSKLKKTVKLHAMAQLAKGMAFIAGFFITILSVPLLWIQIHNPTSLLILSIHFFSFVSLLFLVFFYFYSFRYGRKKDRSLLQFIIAFFTFLFISMGTAFHNCMAVIEGYIGRKTPFIRTPKFNSTGQGTPKSTVKSSFKWDGGMEVLMAGYFIFGLYLAIQNDFYHYVPFHLILVFGYLYISFHSLGQFLSWKKS